MYRHRLYKFEPRYVRAQLKNSLIIAREIHRLESELVQALREIDEHRFYVRLGFRSLRAYCFHWLRFTGTQSQRIVTNVRRFETMFDSEHKGYVDLPIGQMQNLNELE